jgi:hypothetical protein
MTKSNPNKKFTFEIDEQGKNEVGDQIMDSYYSGFIDLGTALAASDESGRTES